ncbi:MAG: DUF3592 domain-containing protein [Pseudomonadota bacterium]
METVSAALQYLIDAVFSEVFAVWFLVGLVIFLVGVGLIVLYTLSRMIGYRTQGHVIGAVEHTKIKRDKRDGEIVERVKKYLMPVFEYQTRDGVTRQMIGSEGGSNTTQYSTGQPVSLIVREDDGYDDVYDADQHGALYLGLGFTAIGGIIMTWVGSFASAFGVSLLTMLALAVSKTISAFRNRSARRAPHTSKHKGEDKSFTADELRPIEDFL